MKSSEKPEFTPGLDQRWRDAVWQRVNGCNLLSVDEHKLVAPLFSERPEFLECRRKVYENVGIGRGSDQELDVAVADMTLQTLKQGRTDQLNIPRNTQLFAFVRDATREVLYPGQQKQTTSDVEGFDLSKINI